MSDSIQDYLDRLRAELAGADPAVVQDALYDAEEYLRGEVDAAVAQGEEADVTSVFERYGEPAEVAAAYLETEALTSRALRRPGFAPAPPAPLLPAASAGGYAPAPTAPAAREPLTARTAATRFFGVLADPQAWGAFFYMLLALATGIAYFTIVVTGLSLSLGMLVLIIGLPMLLLFVGIVRAISFLEGRLIESMLGERMPRRPQRVPRDGTVWERIKNWFTDYRTWTTMLYMVLQLPLGIVYFTLVVTAVASSLWGIVAPIFQVVTDLPVSVSPDYAYYLEPWAFPFVMLAGVLGFVLMMHVVRGIGRVHAAYAKVMLVGRADTAPGE